MATLTERLGRCRTGAVHGVPRMPVRQSVVLPPELAAIAPGTRLARPALAVARHIDRTGSPDLHGEPVTIGAVTFATRGDLPGDRDGVGVTAQALAAAVVSRTDGGVATGGGMGRALAAGTDPVEACNRHGKL